MVFVPWDCGSGSGARRHWRAHRMLEVIRSRTGKAVTAHARWNPETTRAP